MVDNPKRDNNERDGGKRDAPLDASTGNPTGVYPVTDGWYPGGEPVSTEAAYRDTRYAGRRHPGPKVRRDRSPTTVLRRAMRR